MAIRSLCITEGADRPTVATFIGMHKAGIDVTVICPADHPNNQTLQAAGVPTLDIRLRKPFDRAGIAALRAELIRGNYDIMHTFNNKAVSNGLRACKGLPVKVVCYRGIVGAVGFLDPMSWMRYLNPRIDRIICVAEAIRRYFLEMQPAFLRMPASRPVTIHKGHKLEWYDATPADLTTLGIPADAFVIGCTANYRPRKGIELLVDALAMLPPDIPAELLLVGHMDAPGLSRHIQKSTVSARVHRVGYRPDAPALSAACDVFCLPSVKREGLPRAVIEAMAYRVAPIVTNSGGSPELVEDGVSGLVVPPRDARALADAIEKLYRDGALRERMGNAARERLRTDFQNEDTVQKTIALYNDLLAQAT
ncbi:MAG: glycosyltransferase family 4 protein [Woeseiaceae bacterium]|nr:glycosyltransferase family 4 protein [Woeseiaceae bacterium]